MISGQQVDTLEIGKNTKYIPITKTLACGPKFTMEDATEWKQKWFDIPIRRYVTLQDEEPKYFYDEKRDCCFYCDHLIYPWGPFSIKHLSYQYSYALSKTLFCKKGTTLEDSLIHNCCQALANSRALNYQLAFKQSTKRSYLSNGFRN